VVSAPSALYPRKWGEFRNDNFSFSSRGRAKNFGRIAFKSSIAVWTVNRTPRERYMRNSRIGNIQKSHIEEDVSKLL
jgi:hypothetical protein